MTFVGIVVSGGQSGQKTKVIAMVINGNQSDKEAVLENGIDCLRRWQEDAMALGGWQPVEFEFTMPEART